MRLIVLLALVAGGCGGAGIDPIAGQWSGLRTQFPPQLTLGDDGRYQWGDDAGTWTAAGGVLHVAPDAGGARAYAVTFPMDCGDRGPCLFLQDPSGPSGLYAR